MNRTALTGSTMGSVLLVSLVLRALLFPGLATTPSAGSPAVTAPAPAEPAPPEPTIDGPWKASQSFFAGWGPARCVDATKVAAHDWCVPPAATATVSALIAIAPDPVRTQMSLTFDRAIEGLQLAAADAKYVMDRYWLPWRVQTKTDGKNTADAGDPASREAREARAAQPGLVLFRKNARSQPGPDVFFVFLVADTATTGVDGTQFRNAVADLNEMCAMSGCVSDGRIHIVGPSFSGSLSSLIRLTTALAPQPFTVYSGSVSSACAMADLRLLPTWPEQCGQPPAGYLKADNPTFKTFVHDTESAVDQFVKAFYKHPDKDCVPAPIAILSEAATTFGGAVQNTGVAQGVGVGKSTDVEKDKDVNKQGNDAAVSKCIANYVYPREIATLRNAARAATGSTTTSESGTPVAAPGQLPLDLRDRTNSSDAPPDYSIVQSPLSKEAVLMNLAAGMRRARYRYIGVSGSNPLDVLFLTNFLRTACPDSRLFVLSTDLMFERELDNTPYIGMVSVTTYPLIEWPPSRSGAPSAPHLPFADEYEQGQYEAARATFSELLPGNSPTDTPKPLWMTVVGAGGYWPIRLLDPTLVPTQTFLMPEDLSGAWVVLLILTSGIAALQAWVLMTAAPFALRFRDFALVSAVPRQRLFFIQIACATVALALAFLLLPAWWYAASQTVVWLEVAGSAALVAVVGAASLLETLYVYRWRWTRREDPANPDATTKTLAFQLLTCLGVWAFAGGLLFAWCASLASQGDKSLYGYFFAYRAVHMGTGVSPLTPLFPLLIAVYAWALFEIWRLRFNDDMRPRLTSDGYVPPTDRRPRPGEKTDTPIADAVNQYRLQPAYVVMFFTVLMIWVSFLHPVNPFQIFEREWFSRLYEVLFAVVVALMLSSGFRMAQIWNELRRLLVELERRPIRAAFGRLKGMSWSFWRQGGEDTELAHLVRSLEAIAKLESGARQKESGLPPLAYFRKQIEALKADADRLHAGPPPGATPGDMPKDLAGIQRGVESVHHALAAGSGNLLLRSAMDEARTCATSSSLPDELAAALSVIDLVEASEGVQKDTCNVWDLWQSTQKNRPVLSALESLREYAQILSRPKPRVSLFFELETSFRSLQSSLAVVLRKAWDVVEIRQAKELSTLSDPEERHELESKDPSKVSPEAHQLSVIEEFIALRYVTFIRGVLGHLRHVMIFLALSFSLALISLNIYSFEPHQSLIWSFTLIFVVTGAMVVGVLMQLHRDPILSRVTGTTGNALDLHFYLRIVAFAAVPLLTLLATHYPALGRYLVSFLQPSLEALK